MAKVASSVLRRSLIMQRSAPACSASGGRSSAVLRQDRRYSAAASSFFSSSVPRPASSGCHSSPFVGVGTGTVRWFSEDVAHTPNISDYVIYYAYKDLMAANWDDLSDSVISDVKFAISKDTDHKAGQEILENVFRAAEAVQEFSGVLMSLKMELDDCVGLTGEDVKPLPDELARALCMVFERYTAYLDSFGPEEWYLRKKVDMELGAKMIHLKMRCGGLDAEWGKVTVLGTSGLSGSYIEQRA